MDCSRRILLPSILVSHNRRGNATILPQPLARGGGEQHLPVAPFDAEDPIEGAFTLEVSSPGIDRPLVRVRDFQRFQGFHAKIETTRPFDGRRRFKGVLLGVDGDTVRMMVDGEEVDFHHPDIHKAKLILTDDLIAAAEESKRL
ncbi:MAG: ribosome maturation factor RimP [Proteobacteria bacterium]|nr:ribosome maturation factor RimP [Pseudomonadota bacterium]